MSIIARDQHSVVVGLGVTGLSCVRYLLGLGHRVTVVDSRQRPPALAECQTEYPQVEVVLGPFDVDLLKHASQLVVSPGVALAEPAIREAIDAGVPVTGDIDLFSQVASAPIIAITGSNGKSTVTTLLAEMAKEAGIRVAVGGNLGTPALDMLAPDIELYILELSSFQLETTQSLGALAATVLNVSADHMDRYPNLLSYHQAKHRIFFGCQHVAVNTDDPLSAPLEAAHMTLHQFGLGKPQPKKFSTMEIDGDTWIVHGFDPMIAADELGMRGTHNLSNALAALCLGEIAGIPLEDMLAVLRRFRGLPHRCEYVRTLNGVDFVNDSKGTNVGATVAALEGLGGTTKGRLLLIAGGQGKDADFAPLGAPMKQYGKLALLMGEDARKLDEQLSAVVEVIMVKDMPEAVATAYAKADAGDLVLLSPACASFDMYRGFAERGDDFVKEVNAL